MGDDSTLSQEDLLALVEDAKDLAAEIDLPQLLDEILQRAGAMTESPSGSVLLSDETQDGFFFAAATGPKAKGALEMFGESALRRIPIWNADDPQKYGSVAGEVFHKRKSVVKDSVGADPAHFKGVDQNTNHRTESMICVPLIAGADCIGVVQLLNKSSGNYTTRDVVLLQHFAAHAAVAIRNARYFRDLLAHKGLFTSQKSGKKTNDLLRELKAPAREEFMTVMFADMRGFTQLSQRLGDPKEIEHHLNEFLTLLATEVMRYDGLVNKFLGDGVLALFRKDESDKLDKPEMRAVRSAFSVVERFAELRAKWNKNRPESLKFLDVGVGIATGKVTIGSVGSGRVKDFTALGNPVNLAAAFESQARSGLRVLVDQPTYNAVEKIIAEADDEPVDYQLRKPDQPAGFEFKRYHIRRLRPETSISKLPGDPESHRGRVGNLNAYYGASWAIVVGVDAYRSPGVPRLSYATADAEAIAEALPRIGFPSTHIQVLKNEKATKDAIQRAIYGQFNSSNRNDRLLIFFALHGDVLKQRKREEGYLLPYDVDPQNLPYSALPMTELAQIGHRLPHKHILFVLDTCFSGYAARRDTGLSATANDLSILTQESVVQLLTAGTAGQNAIEEGGHGIFTRFLLKGLEGSADQDGTGLTALKLAAYVQERVVHESQSRQTPQCVKLDGEGEFLFVPPQK